MALTDQVIMPGSDYQAICNATRNLTSKTATLKSGEISTELETVTPQGETWVLGLVPSSSSGATGTFSAIFTSSYYNNMIFYGIKCSAIPGGYKIEFYTNSEKTSTIIPYSNGWGYDNMRKLTFKNPPTDAKFLSWLNVWQGEKQNTDLAVCSEDSITIHNTPYVYTPEHPYDGTKKLNITISPTTQATPSISVNADGLITASATQSAGYVTAGTKSATQQLPIQAAKTVTPSAEQQTAVASGKYTTGAVTVKAVPTEMKIADLSMVSGNQVISNTSGKYMISVTVKKPSTLIPSNIKKGVNIGGVIGTVDEQHTTVVFSSGLAFPTTFNSFPINIKFRCNGVEYTSIEQEDVPVPAHSKNLIYKNSSTSIIAYNSTKKWTLQEYRKITILEKVDESLLTLFDEAQALYNTGDYAIQATKQINIIDSDVGTNFTMRANPPYDVVDRIDVDVQDISTGVDLPFTKLATVSTDNGILSFSFTGYYDTIIAKRSGTNKILTAVFGNNLEASFGIGSSGVELRTSLGFSYNQANSKYNVTWNICESSGSVWYEGSYDIYGCRNG